MDNITNQPNDLRPEYITRIVNAVKNMNCKDDHEDVWSVLYEYEQRIKSNFGCELYMLQDIINHQREKLEGLKEYNNKLIAQVDNLIYECDCAKQEAYKEVAEWLKEEIKDSLFAYEVSEHCERIDNILKKKIGEYNAK